ncbi:Chymotrypsin-like protease CTRL-1 [Araneus ventricosus]|uniref:Chymotrypsin-like protease CTRL-1 n=1 Tax=Araneus ventricosus TaxID=182803 RepID=A0A4Y2H2Y3_ARAVE|nr:Chymotrypsin-like protease CTRL-1 [Araneus ventricosus]
MNGTDVPLGKYPWIVSFKRKNTPNFCTGSIITSKYILTAAHCLENLDIVDDKKCQTSKMPKICFIKEKDMLVGLQDMKGLKLVEVKRNIPHPDYSAKTAVNDIALIQLKKPIKCSLLPKPLCLPRKDLSKQGQSLIIAGYGVNKPGISNTDKLMEGEVKQVSLNDCGLDKSRKGKVLCARGAKSMQASCQGDSGSTIVKILKETFYGIGVTSVGPTDCTSKQGDTYTNVYKYMKWIKKHVKNLPKPKKVRSCSVS